MSKARKYNSLKIKTLLEDITPIEMEQTKIKMLIATRIEDSIKERGLTKSKFAEMLGKHPSEITKWLSGTHNFTMDVLIEIAFALEIEVDHLLAKKTNQQTYKQEISIKSAEVPIMLPLSTSEKNKKYLIGYYVINLNKSYLSDYPITQA